MAVVALKIADYTYKIACQDGQEEFIRTLASYLDEKAQKLTASNGFIPENQLLAMVSVLVAQELFHARSAQSVGHTVDSQTLEALESVSNKILELAQILKKS